MFVQEIRLVFLPSLGKVQSSLIGHRLPLASPPPPNDSINGWGNNNIHVLGDGKVMRWQGR